MVQFHLNLQWPTFSRLLRKKNSRKGICSIEVSAVTGATLCLEQGRTFLSRTENAVSNPPPDPVVPFVHRRRSHPNRIAPPSIPPPFNCSCFPPRDRVSVPTTPVPCFANPPCPIAKPLSQICRSKSTLPPSPSRRRAGTSMEAPHPRTRARRSPSSTTKTTSMSSTRSLTGGHSGSRSLPAERFVPYGKRLWWDPD